MNNDGTILTDDATRRQQLCDRIVQIDRTIHALANVDPLEPVWICAGKFAIVGVQYGRYHNQQEQELIELLTRWRDRCFAEMRHMTCDLFDPDGCIVAESCIHIGMVVPQGRV